MSFKSAQISTRRPETRDTSLALPAEENMAVLHEQAPDRNARVQEQVRLILARKKKDAISNGECGRPIESCQLSCQIF